MLRLSGRCPRARASRAQVSTIVTLVTVSIMALMGFVGMSLLSSGFFSFPTNLMIAVDEDMIVEDLADMMINSERLMAYEDGGVREAGVIEIRKSGNDAVLPVVGDKLTHSDYRWRVSVADLTEKDKEPMVRDSGGITGDWKLVSQTSRYVTLVRMDRDSTGATRNPGQLNLTLYRMRGEG